jgi:hypothetical protein
MTWVDWGFWVLLGGAVLVLIGAGSAGIAEAARTITEPPASEQHVHADT